MRPLQQLKNFVLNGFLNVDFILIDKCVVITREKSPSVAFQSAQREAFLSGVNQMEALKLAKAARWLAVIRRDYGKTEFDATVRQLGRPSQPVWLLASGEAVVDRAQSHLHGDVARLLPEVFAQVNSEGRQFINQEVDLGREVGKTVCVATRPWDRIVFAQRHGRQGLTRFVIGRESEPCSSVVVIMKKREEGGGFVLLTAFVGQQAQPEPWNTTAGNFSLAKSLEFWNSHALIWGSEPVIPGTETDEKPW